MHCSGRCNQMPQNSAVFAKDVLKLKVLHYYNCIYSCVRFPPVAFTAFEIYQCAMASSSVLFDEHFIFPIRCMQTNFVAQRTQNILFAFHNSQQSSIIYAFAIYSHSNSTILFVCWYSVLHERAFLGELFTLECAKTLNKTFANAIWFVLNARCMETI